MASGLASGVASGLAFTVPTFTFRNLPLLVQGKPFYLCATPSARDFYGVTLGQPHAHHCCFPDFVFISSSSKYNTSSKTEIYINL